MTTHAWTFRSSTCARRRASCTTSSTKSSSRCSRAPPTRWGRSCAEFEAAFAAFCGVAHCAGVSTGTDAVRLALQAAGVGPGDEVIVPVNTFIATAEAVSHCGATPVFVDCLPDTANIDPSRIGEAVTPRTVAILPVHLYGQPADMESIGRIAGERGLAVVEDACQAHGASVPGQAVRLDWASPPPSASTRARTSAPWATAEP